MAQGIYELSYAMAPSMPVYHQHIPYSLALHRRHGDPHPAKRPDGSSFANEVIVTSGHSGTHIDALGHFSRNGCLHGGIKVSEVETRDGYSELNAADIPPIPAERGHPRHCGGKERRLPGSCRGIAVSRYREGP